MRRTPAMKKPAPLAVRTHEERSENLTMCERCRAAHVARCLLCCRDLCDECGSQATCPNARDGGHRAPDTARRRWSPPFPAEAMRKSS